MSIAGAHLPDLDAVDDFHVGFFRVEPLGFGLDVDDRSHPLHLTKMISRRSFDTLVNHVPFVSTSLMIGAAFAPFFPMY
ncbi:MAG: hypothetical protein NVS4B5_19540 [Vulcanimicrobiaceae bacterium]